MARSAIPAAAAEFEFCPIISKAFGNERSHFVRAFQALLNNADP